MIKCLVIRSLSLVDCTLNSRHLDGCVPQAEEMEWPFRVTVVTELASFEATVRMPSPSSLFPTARRCSSPTVVVPLAACSEQCVCMCAHACTRNYASLSSPTHFGKRSYLPFQLPAKQQISMKINTALLIIALE